MKTIHIAIIVGLAILLSTISFALSPANAAGLSRGATVNIGNGALIDVRGCHRYIRGNRRPHYHVGRNCRRVNARRRAGRDHCHHDARRHGTQLHRHVGRRCARRILRRANRYRRGCIAIGPVYFCD